MSTAPYKNPDCPLDQRIADLLSRMNREEKVGQLMQLDGGRGDLDELIGNVQVGSLLHIQNEAAAVAMDKAARTRLGIPILFGDDCIHGHSFHPGATIFPTQLAMAASWNSDRMEEAARITAREARLTGLKWTFSPVLCLTRDLRWGRVGETFGEDPWLIGEFGAAMIRGYQGQGLDDSEAILACAKHYAGYSETQGGRDASEADLSQRKLRSYFLPPFQRAAEAGCLTFMTGYQSIEGAPSTINRWLLHEVLREEWDFEGIIVTDWDNVGRLVWEQKVCEDYRQAAAKAIQSGNDLMMSTPGFREGALQALDAGWVKESELDVIVERLLALKFRLGLFEDPGYPDLDKQAVVIGCEEHRQANLELARDSLILLQNDADILPFDTRGPTQRLGVFGPNADDVQATLGDWAGDSGQVEWMPDGHPRGCTTTVLDGLRKLAPEGWKVTYQRGANITEYVEAEQSTYDDGQAPRKVHQLARLDPALLQEAQTLAEASDLLVAVVGDDISLIGECCSTATLELQGGQIALLEALVATGKPLVLVLMNSKPLVLPACVHEGVAILEAFNPGMCGGTAIAEAIFGLLNPSGKLTVSIPYHVGQQPVYYAQVRGQHGDRYADLTQRPHFPFGHGLSYTTFEYSNPRLVSASEVLKPDDTLVCEVDIRNTGERAGTEIAQLYISDLVTSVTWVDKELKAFQRVHLEPGQQETVRFEVPIAQLSLVDTAGKRILEDGAFKALIGPSSAQLDALSFQVRTNH